MSRTTAFGRQALAWAVASVSVWFAWRYGTALGAPGGETAALGPAFAVLDLFKCLMPMLTIGALSRRRYVVAVAGAVGFVGLSLLNIWATMSVEVLERAALAAKHTTAAQQLADLEAESGRAENRLREIGKTMTVGTVEADMAAKQYDRRWTASNGCTAVTSDSRAYCAAYQKLFGHLAAAQDAENQRARLDKLQAQISQLRAAQTPNPAELQLVAKLTGIDAETAGLIRAFVFAAVVEIVCSLAPTLVWVNRPGSRGRRRRRGKRPMWLAWWKSNAPRDSARFKPTTTPASPACQALEGGGEKEVSPSPAPPETGSVLRAERGEAFEPTNDGTPGWDEASVPHSYSAVRATQAAPKGSLDVVRSPTLGSGPGGSVLPVQGGAAVASKDPAVSRWTDITRVPAAEVHAPAARKFPMESRRTRPRAIAGARTRARTVSSLLEGGRLEDSRSPASPRPVTTGRCVCSKVADFVRERLEIAEGASISAAELRSACHSWFIANGHKPLSGHRLGAALRDFGFDKWKSDGRIRYRDLRLRA